MKKKELVDKLVSEFETGKSKHWGFTVMGLQVNQPLHRNYIKP